MPFFIFLQMRISRVGTTCIVVTREIKKSGSNTGSKNFVKSIALFFFLLFLEHYAGATTETTEANANLPAEVENKKEGGQNGQHHGEQLIPVSPKSFLTFFSV